jgi:hypothetical protein
MIYYAEEANKLICNADGYDYGEHHNELIVDKHFLPLKYMIEEMVELFAIAEVIKYELRYQALRNTHKDILLCQLILWPAASVLVADQGQHVCPCHKSPPP